MMTWFESFKSCIVFQISLILLSVSTLSTKVSCTATTGPVSPLSVGSASVAELRANNFNVTVMADSDVDAEGNERNTHINNTFTDSEPIPTISQLNSTILSTDKSSSDQLSSSSSEFSISYSQLFETTVASNDVNDVNDDKVEHKWHNETNETIDWLRLGISASPPHNLSSDSVSDSEPNSNSTSNRTEADNSLKLFQHNEAKAGISAETTTSLSQTDANIEASHKSWPKLASNAVSAEKSNESHKSINTYGLVIENIASEESTQVTVSSNATSSQTNTSERLADLHRNTDNKTRIISNEKSVEKQNIDNTWKVTKPMSTRSEGQSHADQSLVVIKSESAGDSSTTSASIDTNSISTSTSSASSAGKYAYSTQLVIPAATDSSLVADIGHEWFAANVSANATANDSDDSTTRAATTRPARPSLSEHSLRVRTTSDPKIVLNVSEQYIDIQYDDNEFLQVHRRCAPEMVTEVNWTATEVGNLATQSCPQPYSGSVYRPCYSSAAWGEPDYSECRLEHLREIQSLIFYHVHKHLVDGLYPLADDLSRLVTSGRFPIRSPLDRLDAIDALNAILRAKIKIRMEDEEKNVNLIQSLTTICDQVLTRTKVVFAIETEKNALITQKTAEALFGFRLLSENILRALIVVCDDGTIRKIKPIVPDSNNIIMTLTHRTPFGSLLPLVTPTNYTSLMNSSLIPRVIIHLEDFNKLGVGISSVWIREMGATLDSANYEVVSDIVLVSVVPAVSIEVDFEETPKVEVELSLKRGISWSDNISCGRIRSARDLWLQKGCETLARNLSSIHCLCNELGIIAAVRHKPSATDWANAQPSHPHTLLVHSFVLYISFIASLLLLVISLFCQVVQRSRESREASFILVSLVSSLILIQLIYISGAPFHLSLLGSEKLCRAVPLVFHLVHLVSAFWMLSHTIFLYQRLWRPMSRSSLTSLPLSDTSSSVSSQCCLTWTSRSSAMPVCQQWDCKHFLVFATALPALSVLASYYLNPEGYETKRYCWLSIEGGMQYSFIVPVSVLIMTNTVIMLLVLKRFFETKPLTHKIEIDKTQPALRAGVTLLPFFAVNWFLSVMALEDTATTAFQCIFAASNLVLSFLVFLFNCYQRYDLHDYTRVKLFGAKAHQKSSLRLRKNIPGRGLRVDIPRLCIGEDRDSVVVPIAANNGSSIAVDCQPLLMPYSGSSLLSSSPKPNNDCFQSKELC